MATGLPPAALASSSLSSSFKRRSCLLQISSSSSILSRYPPSRSSPVSLPPAAPLRRTGGGFSVTCCLPLTPKSGAPPSTKLYVSGLSFRTTEESLRKAFQNFGQLVEVNLVMDRIANRPRGFAFLRYATEEESEKAIEGMHGKFLDGRVIFVEVAKPRSEVRQASRQNPRRY